MPSFVDLPALLLGADRILPSGRVIGVIIGAVILLGMFCAWLVVRSLRKSALKSWAASRNLQYDKGTFKGLAFVSGDTVRYQASSETGNFPITYTVEDNLGNAISVADIHKG